METLHQIVCSHTNFERHNNTITIKKWYYYKEKVLHILEYHCSEYKDEKHNKLYKNEHYYNTNNELTEMIISIDTWLETHLQYLIHSNNNYNIALNTVEYIKTQLGDYNTYLPYKCVWNIPKVVTLSVYLYSNRVVLYYKNTETILCDKKLKSFIQKNKKTLLHAQDKVKEQSKLKLQEKELQEKELQQKELQQKELQEKENVIIRKELKPTYFYIKKSLKERYHIQACKPLPTTYPWEN